MRLGAGVLEDSKPCALLKHKTGETCERLMAGLLAHPQQTLHF